MGAGGFFTLGSLRPMPRWCGGLPRLCIIEHSCRMGAGASFALGPPRPSPRWRVGLLRVWIIEAPVTWAKGLLCLGTTEDHAGLGEGLHHIWMIEAPVA